MEEPTVHAPQPTPGPPPGPRPLGDAPPGPPQPIDLNPLLADPEFRKQVIGALERVLAHLEGTTRRRHETQVATLNRLVLAIVFVGLLIVVPVTVLVWAGKMPPESGQFVFAGLMGASFTVLGNILFPKG